MPYHVDAKADIDGTSLRGNISTCAKKLKVAFGNARRGDGYKTTMEWHFVNDEDPADVYTIYDWKTVGL